MKVVTVSEEELKTLIREAIQEALELKPRQNPPDEFMRRKEVAKFFKVSLVTVNQWMKDGRIPFHRLNSRIYFKKSEVLASLKTGFRGKNNRS